MPSRPFRLLLLLAFVVAIAVFHFAPASAPHDWERPLRVVVYPFNADGSDQAQAYIDALQPDHLDPIAYYMTKQAGRYDLELGQPFVLELANPITDAPAPPDYHSFWGYMRWGVKLRLWYWTFDDQSRSPDIRLIARYQDSGLNDGLDSLGVEDMKLAFATLSANDNARTLNEVVIAHELLHTVGAEDLYDPATQQPTYPEGYAEPERQPLFPQSKAELMAGRIPVAPGRAEQAEHLERTTIGETTARDIGWKVERQSEGGESKSG